METQFIPEDKIRRRRKSLVVAVNTRWVDFLAKTLQREQQAP